MLLRVIETDQKYKGVVVNFIRSNYKMKQTFIHFQRQCKEKWKCYMENKFPIEETKLVLSFW